MAAQPGRHTDAAPPFRKRTFTVAAMTRDVGTLLRRGRSLVTVWTPTGVDPLLREQVMFAVAMVNDCKFCAFMHDAAAITSGADRDGLARLVGLDPADATDDVLIAVVWAQSRAANGLGRADEALERRMENRYSPQQIRDLDTVVRVMTLLNVSGNTAEALIRRVRGQSVPGSRVVDELIVGGTYLVGAVVSALSLALRRRVSPKKVWHEFDRFDGRALTAQGSVNGRVGS